MGYEVSPQSASRFASLAQLYLLEHTGRFNVDRLKEIAWNDKVFDNLVLPGGEKELAWEFVESRAMVGDAHDDFIHGKGESHGTGDKSLKITKQFQVLESLSSCLAPRA